MDFELEDVFCIPNYVDFIKNHFGGVSRWAKKELTVHQFHFCMVPKSPYFPLGVRTAYRDYVSDRVIELKAVEKLQAITRIGQLTGYDPVTHHSCWYPGDTDIPFRSTAGIYFLRVRLLVYIL